jgi:hypothetical protein
MSYYTRMKFAAVLRSDTPSEVLAVLSAVAAGDGATANAIAPKHEFFEAEHWHGVLRGQYAAPSWPDADGRLAVERSDNGSLRLTFHSSTKNYDSEIDKFLAWIGPHVAPAPGELLGEFQGEESDRPTLLVAQGGRIDKLYVPAEGLSLSSVRFY